MKYYNADGCCSSADYQVNPAYAFEIQTSRVVPLFTANERRDLSRVVKSHDSGNIYWRKIDSFLNERELMCDNMVAYQLPRERAVDIDTMDDLKLAEYYYGKR
jgi:CMP-N-acetylneuraminic acid synthetase